MKKLLMIALIAFGAPANADNQEECNRTVEELFYYVLAGAPFEVLKMRFNLHKDKMTDPDDLMLLMFDQIYLAIGEEKFVGQKPDRSTIAYIKSSVCSDYLVKDMWK